MVATFIFKQRPALYVIACLNCGAISEEIVMAAIHNMTISKRRCPKCSAKASRSMSGTVVVRLFLS
jgi:predicted nucleic acid-binding Zn ribbon protein